MAHEHQEHQPGLSQVSLKLDHDLRAELEQAAHRDHRTVSSFIRHVLIAALQNGTAARSQSQQGV
jgi:uncharacterized protein (DUF1778 family)